MLLSTISSASQISPKLVVTAAGRRDFTTAWSTNEIERERHGQQIDLIGEVDSGFLRTRPRGDKTEKDFLTA